MANVARFTLSSARDLNVYGAGRFIAGVLDVDANDLDLLERTRYLVQPYGAVELGIMDEATPKPVLPAVPGPPEPDPYPQYPTMDEIVTAPELRAAFEPRPRALGKARAGFAARVTHPARVVFLGSSTTVDGGATVIGHRYVNLVTAALQSRYPSGVSGVEPGILGLTSAAPSFAPGIHAYNGGVAGTNSGEYVTETMVGYIGALDPCLIVHMIGSNDYNEGVSVAEFRANVEGVIADLDAVIDRPHTHLLVHAWEVADNVAATEAWSAYGAALDAIAAASPDDVAFLDASLPFALTGLPDTDPLSFLLPDDVHGRDHALALVAEQVTSVLVPPVTAGTGATIQAFDRFNRSDSASALGDAEVGGTWVASSGTWGIAGNKAYPVAGGVALVGTDLNADMSVAATVTAPSSGTAGVAARAVDANNRIAFYFTGSGAFAVAVTIAGTTTALGANIVYPHEIPVGQAARLRLDVFGSTVLVYCDGILLAGRTLSGAQATGLAAGRKGGLRASGASATTFDDFLITGL